MACCRRFKVAFWDLKATPPHRAPRARSLGYSRRFHTISPVVRAAMQVRNGEDQDVAVLSVVDDTARKPSQTAAPDAFTKRMPRIRKAANSIDRRHGFQQEGVTQTGCLSVVVRNRFVELLLRDLKETNIHFTRYFASTSSNASALISPRR